MNYLIVFVLSSFAFTFDGVSITYEGVDFQSATFHKENLIYGLDFIDVIPRNIGELNN